MGKKINLDTVFVPSQDDVVARDIQGELILIPITRGVGDLEDEIYTLNETGKAIWKKLDGNKDLKAVVKELSHEFEAPVDELGKDVLGLAEELLKRKMLVVKSA